MKTSTTPPIQHTRVDIAMENVASLDILAREWGEGSPVVERFERAVNSHAELLEIVKEDRRRYPDGSGRAKELDDLIRRATGKGE